MAKFTTVGNYHSKLVQEVFPEGVTEDDAILLMAIFYVCEIELSGNVLRGGKGTSVAAITIRHAGEAVGSLWRGRDKSKARYVYWLWKWCTDGEGEHRINCVSQRDRKRLRELKELLEAHPTVKEIVYEDPEDDLF